MNLLKHLLVLVSAAAMMGSAQVRANTYNMRTLFPTIQEQSGLFVLGGSFVDVYNFSIGAEYQMLATSAVSYSPTGTGIISDLTLTLYGGADGTGSVLGSVSSSNGSYIDYSKLLAVGNFSVKVSGLADGFLGGGYNFSIAAVPEPPVPIAAVPEPSEWMMLLAGLVFVGFMARRKTDLLAG